ncbi:MAG: hypothetical protein JWO36_536 [Myxococcales bacterium]|nr:hypothetical protein [Myxococcales bacterium]
MKRVILLCVLFAAACGSAPPKVKLTEDWPARVGGYEAITWDWTRTTTLRGSYQEILGLSAIFKAPEWRAAHAEKIAAYRKVTGQAKDELLAQAQADMAGPYEVELLVTTWDRRENDLDRGKKSVWHVVLVDEKGHEIEPLEIVRDKRPVFDVRAEFPALGDFAVPYIARFPRTIPLLGPTVRQLGLRMSSERGGVELSWLAP